MRRTALGVLFSWLMLILAPAVVAQQTNGIIQGTVSDAAGASVAGATVVVISDSTAYTRTVTSGVDGSYAFTELLPGRYHIKVTKEGFKTEAQQNIELHVASTVVLNVKLAVGSVAETLTVEANPIAVDTTTAALGNITEGAQVRELPLNGLNFIGLTLLVPGASTMDGFNASTKGVLGGSDIVFSGGQRTGNVFTVDGAPNNDMGSQRTILAYPSLDAISEVKLVTNAYGPEYGQSGGGQVNIVTKSGTNALHGSVYYFGRNDALDANSWFNTNTVPAVRKGELRRNDFGFTLGGPVLKDKLFFFFSQEFNREVDGDLHTGQTPSAAELSGDFSGVSTGTGGLPHLTNCYFNASFPQFGIVDFPVKDPKTGTLFGPVNDPITGLPTGDFQNIGQTSEGFGTAGKLITQLYPAANVTPTAANPCPNPDYKQSLLSAVNLWQTFARADYNINKSTTVMLTYTQSHWSQPAPSIPGGEWGDTGFPAVDSSWAQPSRIAAIRLSRTIGNTAVNDFQFSYSGNRINITPGGTDPGLSQQIYSALNPTYPLSGKSGGKNLAPPVFWGPGGYSTLWNAAPWYNRMDRYTWSDDYSKVVGKHQFKFGALLAHNVKNQPNNGDFNESPAFWGYPGTCTAGAGACGAQPWGGLGPTTGNAIASILINGSVWGYGESSSLHNATGRYQDYEFYGGDTFRATRRLTVTYGFRWSLLMQPYAADNELAFFNPKQFDPTVQNGSACDGLITAPGSKVTCSGLGLAGSSTGTSRSIVGNIYHNIAPRVGVAWDLFGDGKTSLRAGVGQFFVRYQLDPFIIQGTQNPPFVAQSSSVRYLDGTAPVAAGFGHPGFGRTLNADIPNNWQWNLSISRELFRNNTMQVSYVGNRGNHLQSYTDISQITPVAGNPVSSAANNQMVCAAPYLPNGIGLYSYPNGVQTFTPLQVPIGDTCRQAFAITNINATGNGNQNWRPYLNYFGQATAGDAQLPVADFGGYSTYHSLQATWRGRIDSRGSLYQFSYTWSKALALQGVQGLIGQGATDVFSDNLNPRHDYGPTGFDRRNIFNGSVVYVVPLMRGANAFERKALGGWSIEPVVTLQSGVPVVPTTGQDLWGTGTNQDRPNRVAGQPCRASGSGIESQWINPKAFSLFGLPLGTDGNASLGDCYGPGENNWDIAIHKDFKISERMNVQFRFEFFNAFNKTQFEGVNGGLGGPQLCFGDVNGNFVPVNAPTSSGPLAADQCYLTGNPLGQVQTIPNGANVPGPAAYQIIPGPGGISQTLNSPNSISQSGFGQATFTRPARQIQYALRFTF